MPRNKDLKRIVRARMQKTGEAYTAARAHVARNKSTKATAEPDLDYAALAGVSDTTVLEKTGRDWAQWVVVLDSHDASTLPHGRIAAILNDEYGVDHWWSQNVAVGYERIKGLREIGQRSDGAYEASKSKTYGVPVETLFNAWADDASRRGWLPGIETVVRTAIEPRSIRLGWPDGTIVAAWFAGKGEGKSSVAIAHQKLKSREQVEQAKRDWSARLDALRRMLQG